jgi:hypothetical protein
LQRVMISSLMFIWLRSTLPQFASYLSSFQTDPSTVIGNDFIIGPLANTDNFFGLKKLP